MSVRRWAGVALGVLLVAIGCVVFSDRTVGELVTFETLRNYLPHRSQAAELEPGQRPHDVLVGLPPEGSTDLAPLDLPPLDDEARRFAFVVGGCAHDSGQLVLEDDVLEAQLLEDGSTEQQTDCGGVTFFLSVFDVPAVDLPARVRLCPDWPGQCDRMRGP